MTKRQLERKAEFCRSYVAARPEEPDLDELRQILGDASVATLAEVARVFNVAHGTVKGGWRPAQMPGSNGNYNLAEVTYWLCMRNVGNRWGYRHFHEGETE